jgi:hypothetical protein
VKFVVAVRGPRRLFPLMYAYGASPLTLRARGPAEVSVSCSQGGPASARSESVRAQAMSSASSTGRVAAVNAMLLRATDRPSGVL